MLNSIRKSAMAVAALGALGLGGAAIAGAAGDPASPGTGSSDSRPARPQREALPSDVAAKVKAAALEEVPGAEVLRTEAGGPYASPYHAHVETADGMRQVVLVSSAFEATAVEAERARGRGPGGPGGPHGHCGRGETALTGETKEKVESAVRARYSGATILRTETNGDSAAPYESHIRTKAGKELEVLVSRSFAVVEARERPARP